jgi:hypothetical protein
MSSPRTPPCPWEVLQQIPSLPLAVHWLWLRQLLTATVITSCGCLGTQHRGTTQLSDHCSSLSRSRVHTGTYSRIRDGIESCVQRNVVVDLDVSLGLGRWCAVSQHYDSDAACDLGCGRQLEAPCSHSITCHVGVRLVSSRSIDVLCVQVESQSFVICCMSDVRFKGRCQSTNMHNHHMAA